MPPTFFSRRTLILLQALYSISYRNITPLLRVSRKYYSFLSRVAMPGLTDESVRAILRLRAYRAPKTNYDSMPLSRRAAVLVLLFPDNHGRLRVVLTLRSEHLRNFAGQVALPGGKADALTETPEDTARREAYEEIGLPLPNHNFVLPVPNPSNQQNINAQIRFSISHLTELPCHLSRNNLSVRPIVAVLLPAAAQKDPHANSNLNFTRDVTFDSLNKLDIPIDLESLLIPRLDPKEVSAVFSTPLEAFLARTYEMEYTHPPTSTPENWYKGKLQNWYGRPWYMHEFKVPVWAHKAVTAGRGAARVGYNDKLIPPEEAALLAGGLEKNGKEERDVLVYYRVWGMTARILIDAARIAYEKEPEFECLEEKGDEDMIAALWDHGMLREERKHGEEFVIDEMFKKGNL